MFKPMNSKKIAATASLLGSLIVTGAQSGDIPQFEAGGSIQSVDPMRNSIVVDGARYRLSQNLKTYGLEDGRYQLKVGQYVTYQLDTKLSEPTIAEISVSGSPDQ